MMINLKKEQFKAIWLRNEIATYHSNPEKELANVFTLLEIPTVTNTPLIAKRIPYSKMTRKNGLEGAIRNKLAARNITLSGKEYSNYNKIMKGLKVHKGDNKTSTPVTWIENFEWWRV